MHATANIKRMASVNLATITAGAGQDGQAQTGLILDRSSCGYPTNGALVFSCYVSLTADKSLFLKNVYIEHSSEANMANASNLAVLSDANGTTVATGALTTSPQICQYAIPISAAKRYIRLKYTPDLDASGTDTAGIGAMYVFDPPYSSSIT